jgi:hypothetical protein
VHRAIPHEVFDRHRTETGAHDVLATGDPSTTFLVEPGERPFKADARLNRRGRSASRVHRLVGLPPLRKYALLQDPVEVQSGQRAQESGGIGINGAPETTLAASSKPRATCSTTWLGDHFPGARGVVQVAADLSAAATRSMTAARWAASTSLTSAIGPPVREPVVDLNEPANGIELSRLASSRDTLERQGRCRAGQVASSDIRQPKDTDYGVTGAHLRSTVPEENVWVSTGLSLTLF